MSKPSNNPPFLIEAPGWGKPDGVHGELRVPANSTDAEIKNLIRERLAKEKVIANTGSITFKKFGVEGDNHIVAFEVE